MNAKSKWGKILARPIITFVLGAAVGLAFFALFYGLSIVNPTNTNWIWQPITHDTAQHQIGWEFFRADSSGGTINGLAYPVGLSAIFMDVIPLIAIALKPFSSVLPANFQYFGIWGLLCYLLMGGLGALLIRKIWLYVNRNDEGDKLKAKLPWQLLFTTIGSLVFVLSPTVMARSFYHPALAGQWLILLGFLLILETPKIKKIWSLVAVWAVVLTVTVLIHPYFLPMMGVLMVISEVRCWSRLNGKVWQKWVKLAAMVLAPSIVCLLFFAILGGFSLGGGSEIHDLEDKGFNLLSFFNPYGYSIIPGYPNRSYSPETMMWLGLGIILALVIAAILWIGSYKQTFVNLRQYWKSHQVQCWVVLVMSIALLVFAMGVRIDLGPITIFQYSVPDKIYEVWSAFRAAAREAWPFYYAVMLLVILWLAAGVKLRAKKAKYLPQFLCVGVLALSVVQAIDILNGPKVVDKHQGFAEISEQDDSFSPLNLDNLIKDRKHIVALDSGFRGDQSGTYVIARTALKYDMTLNIGFFARVPDQIWNDQSTWRDKLTNGEITDTELGDYLFFTTDDELIVQLGDYELVKVDKYYFVAGRK